MALALVSPRAPKPVVDITVGRSRIQLFHGDCVEVLPHLAPASIGVVVTSPPYNLGIKYRSYEDDLPRAEYLAWTDRWLRAASRAHSREMFDLGYFAHQSPVQGSPQDRVRASGVPTTNRGRAAAPVAMQRFY